jgi:hypothetical protein
MRRTHGMSKTPLYCVWKTMRSRCKNKSNNRYKHYGGRGISVCKEWESFEGFLADMGDGYRPGLTIDRIDTNGGYSPENCRWVTQKVQQRNRTNNAVVDSEYGTMTIAELAEVSGINYQTIESRRWRGWSDKDLTKPIAVTKKRFGED